MSYRKFLVKNLPLKFLSLLLAFLLWIMVSGEKRQTVEIMVRAPVGFQNLPKNLELVSFSPKEVSIRLKVQKNMMFSQDYRSISVMVDLSGAREGEEVFPIKKDMVILPETVQVVKITPSYVRVKLEAVVQRRVKIKPVFIGNPPPWFDFKGYRIEPPQAVVSGTRSALSRIKVIYTEPFNLKDIVPGKPVTLKIIPPKEAVSIVSPQDGTVTVLFEGREKPEKRTIKATVGSYRVVVVVEGFHSRVAGLGPEVVKGLVKKGSRLIPRVELPPGVKMVYYKVKKEKK